MIDNIEMDPNTYWIQYRGNTKSFGCFKLTYIVSIHTPLSTDIIGPSKISCLSPGIFTGDLMMSGSHTGFGYRIAFFWFV